MVKPPPTEKSYHIFYQMMAGLSVDERAQLGLEGYTVRDLMYLNLGKDKKFKIKFFSFGSLKKVSRLFQNYSINGEIVI